MKFYVLENLCVNNIKDKSFDLFDFFKKNKVQYTDVSKIFRIMFQFHYHLQVVSDFNLVFVINSLKEFVSGAPYMFEIELNGELYAKEFM